MDPTAQPGTTLLTPLLLTPLTLLVLTYLAHLIHTDYTAFLALGPGGTPSTPTGYIRVTLLRLIALKDVYTSPLIPANLRPQSGSLTSLPPRSGFRPTVAGIAPHRQTTQRSTPEIYARLCAEIRALSRRNADTLYLGTSCFEKHSTGLFSLKHHDNHSPSPSNSGYRDGNQSLSHRATCNGEIVHAHPSDGSMHLTLHPADVRTLIESGWGERHPLAREPAWWMRWRFVPPGFVMVYAPRDEAEVKVVKRIIRAATWWVSGMEVRGAEVEDDELGEEMLGEEDVVQFDMTGTRAENGIKVGAGISGGILKN